MFTCRKADVNKTVFLYLILILVHYTYVFLFKMHFDVTRSFAQNPITYKKVHVHVLILFTILNVFLVFSCVGICIKTCQHKDVHVFTNVKMFSSSVRFSYYVSSIRNHLEVTDTQLLLRKYVAFCVHLYQVVIIMLFNRYVHTVQLLDRFLKIYR